MLCRFLLCFKLVRTDILVLGSCRKSSEIHDKRHREIAELLQRILDGDDAAVISSPLSKKKRKTRQSDALDMFKTPADFSNDCHTEEDLWADSSTLYDDDLELNRSTSVDKKENCGSKKTQKAERRIARNQCRFKVMTIDDVKRVNEALHPLLDRNLLDDGTDEPRNNLGLPNNATINANIAFSTRTFRYSSLRLQVHNKKILKANGTPNSTPDTKSPTPASQNSPFITTILLRLGISSPPLHPHKERKPLVTRLRHLIAADLECVDNEERETMMRMAGYWRYANRRTYNAMVRNNQLWDWETGAKLEEIEDESDFGDDNTDDGGNLSDLETAVATPPLLEDYADAFDLDPETAALQLVDRDALLDAALEGTETKPTPITATARILFSGLKDTRRAPLPHIPDLTTHAHAPDPDATPTRATFAAIADTRFRTTTPTPTHPAFPPSNPTTIMTPRAGFPPLPKTPLVQDPNNRFSPLAAAGARGVRPVGSLIVRPVGGLVVRAPGREAAKVGKGDGWKEVGRRGR